MPITALARAAALVLALSGCAAPPGLGGRAPDPSIAQLVENRLWIEQDPLVPGAARAWLASGELVFLSCWEVPRLARWRWAGPMDLRWVEAGTPVRAEVAAAGPQELVLVLEEAGLPRSLRFRAAEGAQPC